MSVTSPITTHVLDTSRGKPAAGVAVVLERQSGSTWHELGRGTTDADGRNRSLMTGELEAGVYRLTFATGAYFASLGTTGFFPEVTILFRIDEPRLASSRAAAAESVRLLDLSRKLTAKHRTKPRPLESRLQRVPFVCRKTKAPAEAGTPAAAARFVDFSRWRRFRVDVRMAISSPGQEERVTYEVRRWPISGHRRRTPRPIPS